jgi:hypothetical protein
MDGMNTTRFYDFMPMSNQRNSYMSSQSLAELIEIGRRAILGAKALSKCLDEAAHEKRTKTPNFRHGMATKNQRTT